MAADGRLSVPQEDFIPHPDMLTPARPLVLWPFTRMNDPRFTWGDRLIQMWKTRKSTASRNSGC